MNVHWKIWTLVVSKWRPSTCLGPLCQLMRSVGTDTSTQRSTAFIFLSCMLHWVKLPAPTALSLPHVNSVVSLNAFPVTYSSLLVLHCKAPPSSLLCELLSAWFSHQGHSTTSSCSSLPLQSNAFQIITPRTSGLILSLLDPRETYNPLQELSSKVFIKMIHIMHSRPTNEVWEV